MKIKHLTLLIALLSAAPLLKAQDTPKELELLTVNE